MECGSVHWDEGTSHIDDADYKQAWADLRAWRIANPALAMEPNTVRTEVRGLLLPILPPPRNTASMYWIFLCITSGDMYVDMTGAEGKWLAWSFWGVVPAGRRVGEQPQPGEDF